MFKFIHCADLHLDSPLRGLSAKPDAPEDEIRSATRRALLNLVDLCIAESVNFVVIAGDVYDGDWQDYSTGLFFSSCMAKLRDHDISVFLIRGNHDAASNITRRLVLPDNVIEFPVNRPATHIIDELKVAIHGQGFQQREVRDNLVFDYPDPVPDCFNIGLLHTSAEGQEGHETYAPCRIDDLVQKGYDYWALGHIHKRQVLHENPYIVFSGNIQGRHIRETGDKGCTLVTVDGLKVSLEHHSLDVLRWFVCLVDLTDVSTDEGFTSRVLDSITEVVTSNPGYSLALRIQLYGRTLLHGQLLQDMERYLFEVQNAANMAVADLVWIEKVKFETQPAIDVEKWANQADSILTLLRGADLTSLDAEFFDEFLLHAKAIQNRMGAYIKREDATRIESKDDITSLLGDAQEMLLAIMAKGGTSL
jgi:DNA repair protein SbcD/Mre11